MPNWSYNTLGVEGSKEDVAHFIATAKSEWGDLDFNQFIKMPDELKTTEEVHYADPDRKAKQDAIYAANIAKYGYQSWYDWACAKWNTKWNAGDIELSVDEKGEYAFYTFRTAWDAPLPVIAAMSKRFPTLKFVLTADEESQAYYYEKHFVDGEEIEHIDLEREPDFNAE